MPSDADLRRELVRAGRALLASGLVRGTQGNLSARSGDGERVIITPAGTPYEAIEPADLVVVDPDGQVIEGRGAPSSERRVHLAIYAARDDVRAIVHTHSPRAVRWSDLGEPLLVDGGAVPTAAFALTGTDELAVNAVGALGDAPAVLLAGHGVVAVGATVEEALGVAERVEAAAETAWQHRTRSRAPTDDSGAARLRPAADADARLAFARRPLVIGIGGGGDVAGALAVAELSRLYHGGDPVVGGVTWERRPIDPEPGPRRIDEIEGGALVAPCVLMAGAATRVRASGVHFAESHMADFLRADTLLIDPNGGPAKVADALAATAYRLGADLTIFVDVGGDVLAHGDEPGLASPLCDSLMLAAAVRMQRAGHPVLGAVFGVGCDGELTPDEVWARVAEVAAAGGFAGARGLTPPVAARLEEAVRHVPTEASAQALKAFHGQTGVSTMRGGRRTVELSPAGALTLFFDPEAALTSAARCAAAVYHARSVEDANDMLHEAGVERTELDWERSPPPGA